MLAAEELIHRYLEDRSNLTEDELDALIAHLRANPADASRLHEQLLLDEYLAQKLGLDRGDFGVQVGQRVADFELGEEEVYNQVSELRAIAEAGLEQPIVAPKQSPWLKYAVAIAASLLLAVGLVFYGMSGPKNYPVATVEELSGKVLAFRSRQPVELQVGKTIYTEDRVEVPAGSMLVWKYKDGTTVQLLGDSSLSLFTDKLRGGKRVSMQKGELLAKVTPQTKDPMIFTTPHAQATVLGTELRLVVDTANTRLDVEEGRVGLMRLSDGAAIVVSANSSGEAGPTGIALRELTWPKDRRDTLFIFEPGGIIPLVRNPDTNNLRQTELEPPRGNANWSPSKELVLEGGSFVSTEAGLDLMLLSKEQTGLTLQACIIASEPTAPKRGLILTFGGPEAATNFELYQEEEWLLARVRTSDQAEAGVSINLGKVTPGELQFIAVTYAAGQLTGYLGSTPTHTSSEATGTFANWQDGPLTFGADSSGNHPWRGKILGAAIFSRPLSSAEILDDQQRFDAKYGAKK